VRPPVEIGEWRLGAWVGGEERNEDKVEGIRKFRVLFI
jgi:hypothetical protein